MSEEVPQEYQRYMEIVNKELENERLRRISFENENMKLSGMSQSKDPNIVEYHLDLQSELDRIYHLLSGHILNINSDGSEVWKEPDDDRLKIFSDHGVKQIMNIIQIYASKTTLLSYYTDEKIINWKVRDFGIELADLLFNRYEAFFFYPTPEELFDKYLPIVKEQNYEVTEEELYKKCIQWSREELQAKQRHFPIMVIAILDFIHSTYLRALGGKTLKALTENVHVNQNMNTDPNMMAQPKFKLTDRRTW